MWTSPCESRSCSAMLIYSAVRGNLSAFCRQAHTMVMLLTLQCCSRRCRVTCKRASEDGSSEGQISISVACRMRTAAGQCCFFALPDRDASGRSAHARVRTHEALCAGWLVLHKVTEHYCTVLWCTWHMHSECSMQHRNQIAGGLDLSAASPRASYPHQAAPRSSAAVCSQCTRHAAMPVAKFCKAH
jgi:hypothetical protein